MRSRTNVWAMTTADERGIPASAQGFTGPEGSRVVADRRADGDDAAGEVVGHGTYEEDGPVTWEALDSSSSEDGPGEPYPNLRRPRVNRVHVEAGQEKTLGTR